jgi:ubiquinone/menaquinone biosynthesis C-methylase UbiE
VGWRIDPEGVETRALSELAPVAGLRVLELGCGDGRLTFGYAGDAASVLAVDPDEERIQKGRAALKPELAGKVTFVVAGAAEVDAPRASFDLALFASSLWWIEVEGVVHALRHVHRLIAPGGTLVDSHPVTEEEVEAEGRRIGVIEETEWRSVVLPNAEARLSDAIQDRLYALEAETEFNLLQHFDTADDLIEAKSDLLEAESGLVRRIRTARPPFVTREHYILRRLRAL